MEGNCELMCAATLAFKYDREIVNTSEEHGYGFGTGMACGSLDCISILSACASCSESSFCSGKDYMTKGI